MTVGLTTLAKGEGSGLTEPRRVVVRDESEWRALWAAHAGPDAETPAVDFTAAMVAGVFAGERPTPGFGVEIVAQQQHGTTLVLAVAESSPPRGTLAPQVVVTPFHLVLLARHDGPVRFVDGGVDINAPRAAEEDRPSSTGLEPNFAAALAYLAGPFSGVLVLLAERSNEFVRFHAYQSIFGLGGLGVLAAALLMSAFAALILSPAIFTLLYWLGFAALVLWIVLWAALLVQAITGRRWSLPLVGRLATGRARS